MYDNLLFFFWWLVKGVLLINLLLALHPLVIGLHDYFLCHWQRLRFEPTMDPSIVPEDHTADPVNSGKVFPGYFRIVHQRLPHYRHVPSTPFKAVPRYALGIEGLLLYYVIYTMDDGEPTSFVMGKKSFERLLLTAAEVARHGVPDHVYRIGVLHRTQGHVPTSFPVMLDGNHIAIGCVEILLRDVLEEISKLSAQHRIQVRSWTVPALRTHVELRDGALR